MESTDAAVEKDNGHGLVVCAKSQDGHQASWTVEQPTEITIGLPCMHDRCASRNLEPA